MIEVKMNGGGSMARPQPTADRRRDDPRIPISLCANMLPPDLIPESEAMRIRGELEELAKRAEATASLVAERLSHVSRASVPVEDTADVLSKVGFGYSSPYFNSLHNRIAAVDRMLHNISDSIHLTEV